MTKPRALTLIVYAPALVGKDGRTVDVIHGMEKALPGLRLKWRLSDSGRPIPLPQRDAWLVESIEDGEFPIVCNGDESYPVTVSGRERSGRLSPGGQPQFHVHAELPLDEAVISAAAALLEAVAEGARAFWGHASRYSYDVMKRIAAPMVGGLASSFALELLVYPALFALWKRRETQLR
jgi:hypothetical protein